MFRKSIFLILLLSFCVGMANAAVAPAESTTFEQAIDRITAREAANFKTLQQYSPMVETYIQELRTDKELGLVPEGDHYFLGPCCLIQKCYRRKRVLSSLRLAAYGSFQ
jgi:hypothetical protein